MTYDEFEQLAKQIFEEIPPEFKEGVDGLEVTRRTVLHPTLPEVYTLGECLSEFYPSDFGGTGEVRSRVLLYYGSFQAVARDEEEWDWEGEIWETITHEIKHHLEHLAAEDDLEQLDFAEDQNFARREGEPFDPLFYRSGELLEPGIFEVDGDLFAEVVTRTSKEVEVDIDVLGKKLNVSVPATAADYVYVTISNRPTEMMGELIVVVHRPAGMLDWLKRVVSPSGGSIEQVEAEGRWSDHGKAADPPPIRSAG